MAYRKHWSGESLGEITNTTTTYSDLVSLTLTAGQQTAGKKYAVFWSGQCTNSVTTADARLRLSVDGSTFVTGNIEPSEVSAPQDYYAFSGLFEFTAHATTPVDAVFKIQLAVETGGNTGRAKNGRLQILELGANDRIVTSTSRVTTTSGTPQNTSASITFTPPSIGDYIAIGTMLVDVGTTAGNAIEVFVTDGTTTSYGMGYRSGKDSTSRIPAMLLYRFNALAASSQTIRLQYASIDGSTVGISEMRLLLLRVDDFEHVEFVEQGADDSGSQDTYTTAASITFTPAAHNHLVLASWRFGGDETSQSAYLRLLDDATAVTEHIQESIQNGGRNCGGSTRIAAYSASSRTIAIQRRNETTSSDVLTSDVDAIAIFDLGTEAAGYTLDAAAGSFAWVGGAATLRGARKLAAAAGSFALTGGVAALRASRKLAAVAGSFAATGFDAVFDIATTGYRLVAGAGSLAVTGAVVSLRATRKLTAASGSFAATGGAAMLKAARRFTANVASFAVTGADGALKYARILVAVAGSFAVTGATVAFFRGRILIAGAGSFIVAGIAAALKRMAILRGGAGALSVTGHGAELPIEQPFRWEPVAGSPESWASQPADDTAWIEQGSGVSPWSEV